MIHVGTCGFCEAREKYFKDFDAVEVQQTFYKVLQERPLRDGGRKLRRNLHSP